MSETEAGLLAAIDADPSDYGLFGLLGDHLAESGREELAEGYWAMAALAVAINPDCVYTGLNAWDIEAEANLTRDRDAGEFWMVTTEWWERANARNGGYRELTGAPVGAELPIRVRHYHAALAWGDLSPADKEKARALLGPPAEAPRG